MKPHLAIWLTGTLLGATVLLVSLPLAIYGVPRGHDWSHELVRVAQIQAAFEDGQLPPAWAPELYHGWGSPIFLFYAPLFATLASLAAGLLGSVDRAIVGLSTLLLTVAALGTMVAARSLFTLTDEKRTASWSAAGRICVYLFLLNPYLLADLYRRNAFSEFTALCLAPWLLAALFAAGRSRAALFGIVATSGLIVLAHNLSALVFCGLTLGALPLIYGIGRSGGRARRTVLTGGAFGLALTMWFWWPAMTLEPLIRSEELLRGKFHFEDNFVSLAQTLGWGDVYSIGPIVLLVLVAGFVSLARTPRGTAAWRASAALLLGALVLILVMRPVSTPLWQHLPWMRLLQFPWRLLGPLALLTALLGGLAYQQLTRRFPQARRRTLEGLIALLALANALPTLLAVRPLPPEVRHDLDWALSPQTIREHGQSATVGDEYVPRAADISRWQEEGIPRARATSPSARVEIEVDRGTHMELVAKTPRSTLIEFARWDFPGWRATVDGRPVTPHRGEGGSLTVRVPSGVHRVTVDYHGPQERRHGIAIGALALVAGLLLGARSLGRGHSSSDAIVGD